MVHSRERQVRPPYFTSREPQALKGLRRSDLVYEMQVYVEEIRLPLGAPYHMPLPDFLYQRLRFAHVASFWTVSVCHRSVDVIFGLPSSKREGRKACVSTVRAAPSNMISASSWPSAGACITPWPDEPLAR